MSEQDIGSQNGKGPPVNSSAPTAWSWLKGNQDSIKIVLAVIAGIFAAIQYKTSHYTDRVKNATDVIASYRNSDGYKATLNLESFWLSDDILKIRGDIGKGLTSRDYRQKVVQAMKPNNKDDVAAAVRGLKDIALCVIQGRCEPTTACMNVAITAQDLRCNFREYIEELSARHSTCVMDEVNYFVDKFCSPWIATYLGVNSYNNLKDNTCFYSKKTGKWWGGEYCSSSITYIKEPSIWQRLFD